jgi:hypothetical protein
VGCCTNDDDDDDDYYVLKDIPSVVSRELVVASCRPGGV